MPFGRRRFALALAHVAAMPFVALAQPANRVRRVGILAPRTIPASPEDDSTYGAFIRRMRELGYVNGRTISLEWRFAEGRYERLPGLARDLAASKVDAILAATPPSVAAARAATSAIPIVMVAVGDPVALGFVESFSRPGGNVTGVSNAIDDVSRKYLELLRLAMPKLSRVIALVNPDNPNVRNIYTQVAAAGNAMGIAVSPLEANSAQGIRHGFETLRAPKPQAVVVQGDAFFFVQHRLIVDLALAERMATMFWTKEPVESGALMSYGQNVADDYYRAADYVDRILKGANPRDLPIEQPKQPKLAINMRTAKALGLRIPGDLLLRADQVVQ